MSSLVTILFLFGFYTNKLDLIWFFRWKNVTNKLKKFIINHILVLNDIFSRSDLLEFLENIQIIKLIILIESW